MLRIRLFPAALFTLAAALVASMPLVQGCTEDNPAQPSASSSGATVTGAGAGSTCQLGAPDGICVAFGPAEEPCTCADCETGARCNDTCDDDGSCDFDGPEDCSCLDCYHQVQQCDIGGGNCNDDGTCSFDEDCLCADCGSSSFCQDNCNDNGSCISWLEGCSCADCAIEDECGGSAMSSSSAGGNGGSGGVVGTGGAGGQGGTAGGGGT